MKEKEKEMKIKTELKGNHLGMEYFVVFIKIETYGISPYKISPLGHRCGYVKIPSNHHFYQKNYNWIDDNYDIEVHGGLTFSEEKVGSFSENGWYIGFDCAHYGDTLETCTKEYVESQCKKLINQIKSLEEK